VAYDLFEDVGSSGEVKRSVLVAEVDRGVGTSAARELRRNGRLPGVLYGKGIDATPLAVDAREFRGVFSGDGGLNELINLQVGGRTHLVRAQRVDRHPTRQVILHVDFMALPTDEDIETAVTVNVVGIEEEAEFRTHAIQVVVSGRADVVPSAIEVDVSHLGKGRSVVAGALPLPEGVTLVSDADLVIVERIGILSDDADGGETDGAATDGGDGDSAESADAADGAADESAATDGE